MKTPPYKHRLQVALALTLLSVSSSVGGKAAVASAHTKAATATPKANGKATGTSTASGTPSATASPTLIMTPELEASKKRALATPPPPKPELITVNSDDGAIATAKYWVQLHYYRHCAGKTRNRKSLFRGLD